MKFCISIHRYPEQWKTEEKEKGKVCVPGHRYATSISNLKPFEFCTTSVKLSDTWRVWHTGMLIYSIQ